MDNGRTVLVIRFSAMGDVAMTVPVIQQVANQNPSIKFVYLSKKAFAPLFGDIPNLTFYPFNPNHYKGFWGLYKLFRQLKKLHIDVIADLHSNLRSRIICSFFKLNGVKIAHLDKGRFEKKQLTQKDRKILKPLKPMWLRYADVFTKLDLKVKIVDSIKPVKEKDDFNPEVEALTGKKGADQWVGISPFAQHLQKVYPLAKMEEVVKSLAKAGIKTYIFGGGDEERETAERWQGKYEGCLSIIGKISLANELNLISQLDAMISMDSAGMHLASLKGINVISIWGATHPFAGFLGFGQRVENSVSADISCRPCSVYGNKPCFRGDIACMQLIDPQVIINKTLHLLGTHE